MLPYEIHSVSIYDINKVTNLTAIILIKILNLFALNLLCALLFEVFGIYLFSIAHIKGGLFC